MQCIYGSANAAYFAVVVASLHQSCRPWQGKVHADSGASSITTQRSGHLVHQALQLVQVYRCGAFAAHLVLVGTKLLCIRLAGLCQGQVHVDVGGALNLEAHKLLLAALADLHALVACLTLHCQLIPEALR